MPNDVPKKGLNTNLTLAQLFGEGSSAFGQLTQAARQLTLGQTWRLNGWARPGDKDVNLDPVLNQLTIEDMKSIANALQDHTRDNGVPGDNWKYVNKTYACGACCACCAVGVQAHHRR